MRIQNENAGSTSLFSHPMAIEPVPLVDAWVETSSEPGLESGLVLSAAETAAESLNAVSAPSTSEESAVPLRLARPLLEGRMDAALAELAGSVGPATPTQRQAHLALLKRWYYRPEVRRPGAVYFPAEDGSWPVRALVRGAGRVAAKVLLGVGENPE